MGDDSPVFHPNNPRTRIRGPPLWERISGALWPLSSCCRSHVHLHGSGDGEAPNERARTTLPPPKAKIVLPDNARPHRLLWWLAGGNVSRSGAAPTIGELRVRKEVELANREMVGYWGAVSGRRRVGRVGLMSASHEDVKAQVAEPVGMKEAAGEDSKAEMEAWIRELVIEQVRAMKEERMARKGSKEFEGTKEARPASVEDGQE
ncbi:hypothetical protein B0A48_00142 [Cryoendolithus antarcticus]|uniref:Uncharacterized protein n=1 Tax=Cryoendolithus antarcticus TaxID=1507870 RepID=A0A1V8TTS1_9PEZI|nr:hypothetical protein B0A48_00142 [Cryoendolithus antarcticus]